MEPITPTALILSMIFWIVYFTIVVVICHTLYVKSRGEPPRSPNLTVMINGTSVSALTQWEERDKRLQRIFLAVAIALVLFPLFLPWLLRQ
jgi:hypothetical protein